VTIVFNNNNNNNDDDDDDDDEIAGSATFSRRLYSERSDTELLLYDSAVHHCLQVSVSGAIRWRAFAQQSTARPFSEHLSEVRT